MFDGQNLVLVIFGFCGVSESGGRGSVVLPAFMVVSMVVSTWPVVLAAWSTILVISLSTVVLLALILLSSKLRDNDGASVATGRGGDGKDNKVKLPYLTLSLPPTVIAMSPLDGTLALLAVAGCMATVAGGFGSVMLFLVALVGVPCSKRLRSEAPPVASAALFAEAVLTVAGLLGLVTSAIPPFGLHIVLFVGAMVVDVMFGLWLCVLWNDFANWRCGKKSCQLAKFCFSQVLCCAKESINVWVDYTSVIAFCQKFI